MSKIISMADSINSGAHRSTKAALDEAIEALDGDTAFGGNKMLIIALDDSNDEYNVGWIQAGMRMSQCLALLEVAKIQILKQMEYLQ